MKTNHNIKRLLFIEDSAEDRRTLADLAQDDPSIKITFATDGEQGSKLLLNGTFDLAIIDLGLPLKNGRQILVEARRAGVKIPIMILTGSKDEFDEPDNLDDGANDYVAKPFNHRALMSRIRALIRDSVSTADSVIRCKDFVFDTFRDEISGEGIEAFRLPRKPARILETLLRSKNQIVTPDFLITEIWGYDSDVPHDTVSRNANRINEKFAEHGLHRIVRCHKEVGYELIRE